MPSEVSFPEVEPRYVFEQSCLAFPALTDGRAIECLISAELLFNRFGARGFTEEVMRAAYQEHRAEIQEIARQHIGNRWIDEEGRVFLTTRFTRLGVSFGERLLREADLRSSVDAAHRVLAEIIGPDAGIIDIKWDIASVPPTEPNISLQITDPASGYRGTLYLRPKAQDELTTLRFTLAEIWLRVLQMRSRKLILKSG